MAPLEPVRRTTLGLDVGFGDGRLPLLQRRLSVVLYFLLLFLD
jgi:hypothetical protein